MSSALIMRKACKEDIPEILILLADDDLQKLEVTKATAQHLISFDRIDGDSNQFLAIAELDGKSVGCLQLTFVPGLSRNGMERCLIEGVRISRHLRGKRLGTQMLEWAIAACRERGCGLVQLLMDKKRLDAQRFYESLGFAANHHGFRLYLQE